MSTRSSERSRSVLITSTKSEDGSGGSPKLRRTYSSESKAKMAKGGSGSGAGMGTGGNKNHGTEISEIGKQVLGVYSHLDDVFNKPALADYAEEAYEEWHTYSPAWKSYVQSLPV